MMAPLKESSVIITSNRHRTIRLEGSPCCFCLKKKESITTLQATGQSPRLAYLASFLSTLSSATSWTTSSKTTSCAPNSMVFEECNNVKHSCSFFLMNSLRPRNMEIRLTSSSWILPRPLIRSTIVSYTINYITMESVAESTSGSQTSLRADSRLLWWTARGWTSFAYIQGFHRGQSLAQACSWYVLMTSRNHYHLIGLSLCWWRWSLPPSNFHPWPSDTCIFVILRVNTKLFVERSFCYTSQTVWNNLPRSVRHSDSSSSFKTALKTHLFQNCF